MTTEIIIKTQEELEAQSKKYNAPILEAFDGGSEFWVWCEHCGRYHYHGRSDGARSTHCGNDTLEDLNRSYVLQYRGRPVTKEMRRKQNQIERKEFRGE